MSASARRAPPIRWVFLDRDGTINAPPPSGEYLTAPEQLELLPDAAEAIGRLNGAGVWTAIVTNQRGIARGKMTEEDLRAIHARLAAELAADGAHLDAIYHCPHERDTCSCRKPRPGMLLRARREHPGLDFAAAAVVGDKPSDVQAGQRVGAGAVLLGSDRLAEDRGADRIAGTLLEAVLWLEAQRGLAPSRHAG